MICVFLDTGILGLVTHPNNTPEAVDCKRWFQSLLEAGVAIALPEITDYELRRKLLQRDSRKALGRLDELRSMVRFLPITSSAMLKAAEIWAGARREGRPTAPPDALDGDVILAAQAITDVKPGEDPLIVTTNVGHLSRFVPAKNWREVFEPPPGPPS
jgi:predicted nucleic acid-binding protein